MSGIVFIVHTIGIYGAARSLQLLLREWKDVNRIVPPTFPWNPCRDTETVAQFYGVEPERILPFFQPFERCYEGRTPTLRAIVSTRIKRLLWNFYFEKQYQKLLLQINPRAIHLNSIVLYPMIHPQIPTFIHIREHPRGLPSDFCKKIRQAAGVICIDHSTNRKIANAIAGVPSTVLTNPVEVQIPNDPEFRQRMLKKYRVPSSTSTVYSIIGGIDEHNKGVHFVIRTFLRFTSPGAALLIFGSGDRSEVRRAKELAMEDDRIIFCGEKSDLSEIYGVSDVIIRGEPFFAVGRTIQEALVSGCRIIIPSESSEEISQESCYRGFEPKIFSYKPRDSTSLLEQFSQTLGSQRDNNGHQSGNTEEYCTQFSRFIDRALSEWNSSAKAP
jgi:hypothetical protein